MCKNWEEASKTWKGKSFGNDFLTYVVKDKLVSHSDAIKYVDAPFWLEAMNYILLFLIIYGTMGVSWASS